MKDMEGIFHIIDESKLDYYIQENNRKLPEVDYSDVKINYTDASEYDLDRLIQKIVERTQFILIQKTVAGFHQYKYVLVTNSNAQRSKIQLRFSKSPDKGRKKNIIASTMKYVHFIFSSIISRQMVRSKGLSVAFLAPDGGGKTTLINKMLKDDFYHELFCDVETRIFRPRILKNLGQYRDHIKADDIGSNPNPHNVEEHGLIKSFVRFTFYNIDFIIGDFIDTKFKKMKNHLVIFDRYYYDYFGDLKRYQYSFPMSVPIFFSRFVPKPDCVFILDADPQILYNRKKEIPLEEIKEQSERYKEYIRYMGNAKIIDVDDSVNNILSRITDEIIGCMNVRAYKKLK